ncbi:unnamed protein product [Menidia menidia]|uniref:(Atlantic silverside) hypothetical protein n=1 Tax=Menidia menidia TaxID=238744 RepID=A0A8S4B419_9TELE|nr:unnamed protein product [Menidia menidia]
MSVSIPGEALIERTASIGGSVTINCKYALEEESSTRYFCRNNRNISCEKVISSPAEKMTNEGRLSLTDDKQKRAYSVTISTLTQEDDGIYWCAMVRGIDDPPTCLSEIHLRILNWDDMEPTTITPDPPGTAKIECKYPEMLTESKKFLCKGDNPFNCQELICTNQESNNVNDGRFTLRVNKRLKHFYVYIKDLNREDSGTYWCVSGDSEYTKFHLSVGIIAGVVVGLVFLAVALILLILCRQKLFKTQACCAAGGPSTQTDAEQSTEGNNGDHGYEEIQLQKQQTNPVQSVYATVNPPPADQLHYASVNFHKDGEASPDKNRCSASGGSAETTLYSTVTKPDDH